MKGVVSLVMLLIFITSCNLIAPATNTPMSTISPKVASTMPPGKPNIIFILTDDLDASAIQYMPKLKSLITDQGETFTNYFVSTSLCCPSRATTLRGQYPHNTQIVSDSAPIDGFRMFFNLEEEKSTIAVWLQAGGYRTVLVGKYLNGYPLNTDPSYLPPGWSEWYSPMKGDPYSEFNYTLNENGQPVVYGNQPQDYGTDVYVGKTVDFIQRSAKDSKPFFVYLAPYAPHQPYTPAPRHADLFADLKAPRTPNYNEEDVSDKPAYIRDLPLLTQFDQNAIDEYYRKRVQSLQAVDEGIEAIVNTLKANGQLDNTYIFFTSDNGYHLGNHRQLAGKISPYEEEMRVTMIVRGPGVPAGVTLDHLTGNVDLAPTWADLAGVKAADFCDGRSLVPLLRPNPPALKQWRQAFLYEYGVDLVYNAGGTGTPTTSTDPGLLEPQDQSAAVAPPGKQTLVVPPPFRGIRLQTLSYVEYKTGEIELYDLKTDPYELQNLASGADPKMLKQLSDRLQALATCKAAECRTDEDAPFDLPARFTLTSTPSPNRFGVIVGRLDSIATLDTVNAAQQPGVGWVRTNADLGVADPDYISYLEAGINVVLTVPNRDLSNIDATYDTPHEWRAASFPYKSKAKYP